MYLYHYCIVEQNSTYHSGVSTSNVKIRNESDYEALKKSIAEAFKTEYSFVVLSLSLIGECDTDAPPQPSAPSPVNSP